MNNEIESQQRITGLIRGLHEKRREILALPPEKALDRILDERQPVPLLHSFPEEDFYFLIHDIGLDDSLELLEMASDRQWEYIMDRDIWHRDCLLLPEITRWLNLFMTASPERMMRWSIEKQPELITYYFFRNVEVAVREHDQDPSDLGEGFDTCDDVFYYRLKEIPSDADKALIDERDSFVTDFIRRLSLSDHILFQSVLLKSETVIPAEAEEEMYRMRNIRLAEKGFLPFEDAVGIYQPLHAEAFLKQRNRFVKKYPEEETPVPVPYYPGSSMNKDNLFSHALESIAHEPVWEHLQSEFAGLCNQIISADQRVIRSREALREVVRKVSAYVSMGLAVLLKEKHSSLQHAAALIRHYDLSRIFRVGYGRVAELKWRAEKWRKGSWFGKQGFSPTFWGEEWLGVLGGLLIKKPLFFDNYDSGVLYRDFYSLRDVRYTEKTLEQMMAADRLLSLIRIPPEPVQDSLMIWKSYLLTPWMRHCLGQTENTQPVHADDFRIFYKGLWQGEGPGRCIRNSMKESFLHWISARTGQEPEEVSEKYRMILENLFLELEKEYAAVSEKNIDPRYILLFHVRQEQDEE